ncbi:pimeloyl-ACP methyl ester carboxylesterase/heme-degrading monooxygenase HmoA [Flavobacterium sp. HSC-32F16]|uniref:alpha/beta fold hydrolase n=1 Tax=Flavobacterium sp. HSC-32F16 TaxID=2910964 RepID=UPI0020A3B2A6|nr:alpha/beta fold hydrolase [Flavobacterium sp. HSC-32F16]MCP2028508.1 pimeloyl-ACP methyl ester carboxylesterase/heme-degrading monooxygenase HmoA [Flavobacterium sp. HSC-32F16]
MKNIKLTLFLASLTIGQLFSQNKDDMSQFKHFNTMEILKTQSHISNLEIAINHTAPNVISNDYPILFLHGSSFPTALSFDFKMNDVSWMSHLSSNGYDVYGLDFLGYGNSDRYPEMENNAKKAKVAGRAADVCLDVEIAVEMILKKTGKNKIYLIGHSWGGTVAALFAAKFPDKVEKLVLFATITSRNGNSSIENIEGSYEEMTPEERINAMKNLTPNGNNCQLAPEIFENWGTIWAKTDPLLTKFKNKSIRFPSGPSQDVEDLVHNKPYFNPKDIKSKTLIIRGEWDQYPNNSDAENLFTALENAPSKKYVVIEKGTHVLHLEKSRNDLYYETLSFLRQGVNYQEINNRSIAVIFEVIPNASHKLEYLDIALKLKPELEKINGFISIERFQSIYNPEKILSLSFWKNEQAIQEWRNLEIHRKAQSKGRGFIFKDYHLRIANVIRDYGMFNRSEAPNDSKKINN